MANYSIWVLEKGNVTVGGGQQLDGVTQGDGSHLLNQTLRLTAPAYVEVAVRDDGSDVNFDDQDRDQFLDGGQTIDGTFYADGTPLEAEYTLTLQDPDTLLEYTAVAFNVNNSSPIFGTVEGLSFIGGQGEFPPIGIDLRVIGTSEGPGAFGNPSQPAAGYAFPICFTPGTRILTALGPYPVERLSIGDLVRTRDRGLRPIRWIGETLVASQRLRVAPQFRPVRIARHALGPNRPDDTLTVSPQHRIVLTGWRAELIAGAREVLVPAQHLVDGQAVRIDHGLAPVRYLHLMFDRHEVITANGLLTESFYPGAQGMGTLEAPVRAELLALFPELALPEQWHGVRPALRAWESALVAA